MTLRSYHRIPFPRSRKANRSSQRRIVDLELVGIERRAVVLSNFNRLGATVEDLEHNDNWLAD